MKTWIITSIALAGLGIGCVLLLRRKAQKDKEAAQTQTRNGPKGQTVEEPNWMDPFDMNYADAVKQWFAPRRVSEIDPGKATELAKSLKAARGASWYNDDDEEAVDRVFGKRIEDKVEVAGLSKAFYERYGLDLWNHLKSFLSDSELEYYVKKHIRRLPDYRHQNSAHLPSQ